jgi:hypothetical protein
LQKLIPNCKNRREDEYQIAEADTKLQKPKRRRNTKTIAETKQKYQIAETEEKTNTKLQKLIPNFRNRREDEIPKQLQRQNRNTKLQKPKRRRIPNCRS